MRLMSPSVRPSWAAGADWNWLYLAWGSPSLPQAGHPCIPPASTRATTPSTSTNIKQSSLSWIYFIVFCTSVPCSYFPTQRAPVSVFNSRWETSLERVLTFTPNIEIKLVNKKQHQHVLRIHWSKVSIETRKYFMMYKQEIHVET